MAIKINGKLINLDRLNENPDLSLMIKIKQCIQQTWFDYGYMTISPTKSFNLFDYFENFDIQVEHNVLAYDFTAKDFESTRLNYHNFYLDECKKLIELDTKYINFEYAFKAIIFIHMANHALENKRFFIAIESLERFNKCDTIFRHARGFSYKEIENNAIRNPKRIANNEQIVEHKEVGLNFAKEVLKEDIDKILRFTNLRELTLDYVRFKYRNNETILEMLPKRYNSMKDWFKKDDYTYPTYLSKRGNLDRDTKECQKDLMTRIKLKYFK